MALHHDHHQELIISRLHINTPNDKKTYRFNQPDVECMIISSQDITHLLDFKDLMINMFDVCYTDNQFILQLLKECKTKLINTLVIIKIDNKMIIFGNLKNVIFIKAFESGRFNLINNVKTRDGYLTITANLESIQGFIIANQDDLAKFYNQRSKKTTSHCETLFNHLGCQNDAIIINNKIYHNAFDDNPNRKLFAYSSDFWKELATLFQTTNKKHIFNCMTLLEHLSEHPISSFAELCEYRQNFKPEIKTLIQLGFI